MTPQLIELYQAEWCPSCKQIRTRLTERGIDFLARQVPADAADRSELHERVGASGIPALIDNGRTVLGLEDILQHLDATYPEGEAAKQHRDKAEWVRQRQLEKASQQR